jgi:peroxiredoxin
MALAGLLGLVGQARGSAPPAVGEPAPEFRLQTAEGRWLALKDLRGSLVLLNFWATWCAPCRREIPALDRISRQFHSRNVRVVGVAVDESGWRVVRPFLAQYRVRYPVVLADRETKQRYRSGIEILPFTLLLDREGRILASFNTALEEEDFQTLIEQALAREARAPR